MESKRDEAETHMPIEDAVLIASDEQSPVLKLEKAEFPNSCDEYVNIVKDVTVETTKVIGPVETKDDPSRIREIVEEFSTETAEETHSIVQEVALETSEVTEVTVTNSGNSETRAVAEKVANEVTPGHSNSETLVEARKIICDIVHNVCTTESFELANNSQAMFEVGSDAREEMSLESSTETATKVNGKSENSLGDDWAQKSTRSEESNNSEVSAAFVKAVIDRIVSEVLTKLSERKREASGDAMSTEQISDIESAAREQSGEVESIEDVHDDVNVIASTKSIYGIEVDDAQGDTYEKEDADEGIVLSKTCSALKQKIHRDQEDIERDRKSVV